VEHRFYLNAREGVNIIFGCFRHEFHELALSFFAGRLRLNNAIVVHRNAHFSAAPLKQELLAAK
jgi:hypothetical protein